MIVKDLQQKKRRYRPQKKTAVFQFGAKLEITFHGKSKFVEIKQTQEKHVLLK